MRFISKCKKLYYKYHKVIAKCTSEVKPQRTVADWLKENDPQHYYRWEDCTLEYGPIPVPADEQPPEAMHFNTPTPQLSFHEAPIQSSPHRTHDIFKETGVDEHGPVHWVWSRVEQ